MIYASFATVLLLAQQTFASPVVKRQAASTSTVATQVVTISSANTAAPPAATNASSQASSAAYPCPSNYTAAFIETSMNFAHPASVVAAYITMFQNASYFGILNGTGGNAIGATRYLVSGNAEVLTQTTAGDPAIVGVNGFNLTNGPIRIGSTNLSTTLSNYSTVIQVVANNSVVPIGNVSTIKLFSNICAQDVNAGRTIQLMSFMGALGNIGILLNGRNLTAAITPIVTLTNTVNTTAVAATQTIASTSIVIAPTQTIQSTLLSLASTVTAVQTITPQTMTATAVQTIVPVASTLVAVTTSTPATSTQTALTTIGQDSRTVTIATTLNPSVASVTASSTVTA